MRLRICPRRTCREKIYPLVIELANDGIPVTVTCRVLKLAHMDRILSELEQFSLQIAAVVHDVGHPGLNSIFIIETGHELAIRYNGRSSLENIHCSKFYTITAEMKGGRNFANLPGDPKGMR